MFRNAEHALEIQILSECNRGIALTPIIPRGTMFPVGTVASNREPKSLGIRSLRERVILEMLT
jgi:hypothetical protein